MANDQSIGSLVALLRDHCKNDFCEWFSKNKGLLFI
jgi:hypothetical protein